MMTRYLSWSPMTFPRQPRRLRPTVTTSSPASRALPAAVAALLVALVVTACTAPFTGSVTPSPGSDSVTASTVLSGDSGTMVFEDDFHDPASGWPVAASSGGISFGYGAGNYSIRWPGGRGYDWAVAPYQVSHDQLSVSAAGTQSTTAPHATALGVYCSRGFADPPFYEFQEFIDGSWVLDRREGARGNPTRTVLKAGPNAFPPISLTNVSVTVEGVCASLSDGHTTRLVFLIDNVVVADVTDTVADLSGSGWNAGIEVYNQSEDLTVTITSFRERAL
jgi:hypothetical protein